MSSKRQILVVVEPDNHPEEVLERATWLATQSDFTVTLLWCDSDVGPLGVGFYLSNEARDIDVEIRVMQEEIIEDLAKPLRKKGLTVNTEVLEQRPVADGILARIKDLDPAYLVKGTEFHAAAERSIFVDTDWQLVRSCPCPLWLVKPAKMRERPIIVAAVDPVHSHDKPAALDQMIVDHAKRIADDNDGEVHLLHTYHWLLGVGAAANRTFRPIKIPIDEINHRMRDEHRKKLDALASLNDIDAEHTHQLPGAARELIPMFVRTRKADLVVMGALARWGLKRSIIGSTAERVLDALTCDILIVRGEP